MRAKPYTITIFGERWKYRTLTKEQFLEVHPELDDALAVTDTDKLTIDFIDLPTYGRVFHELTHAYVSYLNMDGTNLKPEHVEEMICHMLDQRVEVMIEQARKMITKLQGGSTDEQRRIHPIPPVSLPKDDGHHESEKR
jgi:hypothetical protein